MFYSSESMDSCGCMAARPINMEGLDVRIDPKSKVQNPSNNSWARMRASPSKSFQCFPRPACTHARAYGHASCVTSPTVLPLISATARSGRGMSTLGIRGSASDHRHRRRLNLGHRSSPHWPPLISNCGRCGYESSTLPLDRMRPACG